MYDLMLMLLLGDLTLYATGVFYAVYCQIHKELRNLAKLLVCETHVSHLENASKM